jgi:circadian clock protein KaiC
VLVSGTAGSGKSSLSAHFADATCRAGERALYMSFEESPKQIMRNMRAIGLDLGRWADAGLLRFVASRPTAHGLETHLALIHRHIVEFEPAAIILDPVSNFSDAGGSTESHSMLVRLVDFLKTRGITGFLTSLTAGGAALEQTETAISSVVDTWLLVKAIELNGERNRGLYVLKSRGMSHSNQVREFLITERGVELMDVYVGSAGVLTGSARANQEANDRREALERERELERKRRMLERRKALFREQLAKLQADFDAETHEIESSITSMEGADQQQMLDRQEMARRRSADSGTRGHSRQNGGSES